jgi:hypothetical protein
MYDYDLNGYDADLEYGLGAVEAEIAAMERGFAYGPPSDYGDLTDLGDFAGAGGAAAGAAGGTVAAAGAIKGSAAIAAAVGGGGAVPATLAAACIGPQAIVCAAAGVVGGTAGALASWRASVKNVARLKAKIKRLRETMKIKVSAARSAGKKRRLKRRYDRRIRRAQKRLDRIERVMKRRIERRLSKQKGLTARQQRLARSLGLRVGGRKAMPGQKQLTALARQERRKQRRVKRGGAGRLALRQALRDRQGGDLPASGDLPEASLDNGFDEGMDLPVEQPIYKQPWFIGLVGIVVIGGAIYARGGQKAA